MLLVRDVIAISQYKSLNNVSLLFKLLQTPKLRKKGETYKKNYKEGAKISINWWEEYEIYEGGKC